MTPGVRIADRSMSGPTRAGPSHGVAKATDVESASAPKSALRFTSRNWTTKPGLWQYT